MSCRTWYLIMTQICVRSVIKNVQIFIPVYVWILSKIPLLSDTYKDLAVRPLNQIGVASTRLLKDDWSDCEPRSYGNTPVEPVTFRFPVQTHQRLSSYHEYNAHNDNL